MPLSLENDQSCSKRSPTLEIQHQHLDRQLEQSDALTLGGHMLSPKIKRVLRFIHLWPPYLGAGIRVVDYSSPLNHVTVTMKLGRRNTNYVGTHFGGNLYSMCDPWYMFILLERLGDEFIVWDKSARIDFLKPGTGPVRARFEISDEQIESIEAAAVQDGKVLPEFETYIEDEAGTRIARVHKTLYVRKKLPKP